MVAGNREAEIAHFDQSAKDLAGIVAELIATKVSREQRAAGQFDVMRGVGGLIGSAYNLAQTEGEKGLRFYVDLLREHADAVEAMLL